MITYPLPAKSVPHPWKGWGTLLKRHVSHLAMLFTTLVTLAGCGSQTTTITISSEPGSRADYGLLLHRIVVGDKIDFDKLLKSRHLLDRYLAGAFKTGPKVAPEQFQNNNHLLAYLINCHNALMLRSLVALAADNGMPASLPADLDRRFQFSIDGGRASSLTTPVNAHTFALMAAAGDWRVRLALYSGRRDGPPLPKRPFLGDMLDAQLNHVVRAALQSEQVVRIDHGLQKRLLLWQGLFDLRTNLVAAYERRFHTSGATILSVLLEWSDRFRRETLNSAVGYAVAPMPVDTRVNAIGQTPAGNVLGSAAGSH